MKPDHVLVVLLGLLFPILVILNAFELGEITVDSYLWAIIATLLGGIYVELRPGGKGSPPESAADSATHS